MVVSFDIYEILNVIELIVCFVYIPFIFFRIDGINETWHRVIRLILTSVLLLINLFQIPMEVQMGKSYVGSIILIILWFINALTTTFNLGKNSH